VQACITAVWTYYRRSGERGKEGGAGKGEKGRGEKIGGERKC